MKTWQPRYAAVAIVFLATVLPLGASTAWASLQPLDLRVDGGDGWRARPEFTLRWSNPPGPVAAVHYRVLDADGRITEDSEMTLNWAATSIDWLGVPSLPGIYTAEVWLEDVEGTEGPAARVRLRFDNARPGAIPPPPVGDWIGRTDFPYAVRLGPPAEPEPLSGIGGYAVIVNASSSGTPCAAKVCEASEIDLPAAAGDLLTLGELPEGTHYLHAVAVSGAGMSSARASTAVIRVDKTDPLTRLDGVDEGWSNRPVTLRATATDAASGMASSDGAFTAIRIDGGVPVTAQGDAVAATVIGSGTHTVEHYARDAAGNVADGGSSNGLPNRAPAVDIVRIDREPPWLAFADAQDPLDPERIEVLASDQLSGLDPARGSIAVRRADSNEAFATLPTTLSGGRLRARWDSEAQPPGEYEFRASAFDRAGNVAVTSARADGSPMRLHGPLKVETRLVLSSPAQATSLPFGGVRRLGGRLLAGRRAPLVGRPVRVIERFAAGAVPPVRTTTTMTGPGGAFSVRLAPGPSREVVAVSSPTATLRGAVSRTLTLSVRGGVTMRASDGVARVGGAPVIFSGRVLGTGSAIQPDGVAVQLQFRVPGLPWQGFRTLRSDARGRFRYAYRFADDDSRGARFQFRAFAPAQAGWPFEPAGSAPVAVKGR